jgi:hypothetical protein
MWRLSARNVKQNRPIDTENMGRISLASSSNVRLSLGRLVRNSTLLDSYTEFHENLTDGLVADIR